MRASCRILGLCVLVLAGAPLAQARELADMGDGEIKALQQRLADGGCYQGAIDGQASPALESARQACPSQDPVLRIETGMHVAPILRIGTDRACRIAATASRDKTLRVWSLPDGQLLRTLRVPIGPYDDGKVNAAAVSPDGAWIAAAGYDAQNNSLHEDFVYVFNAATGAMVARAGPIGNVLLDLAFSPTAAGWRRQVLPAPVSR